ncbi:MAG: family 20 glycosylhydrolase [Armatimonadetes bacterium]|nr:family 20 glycosylhydrolase [Armatimonadota bacterium]MDW8122734.1 family 20 glycosylhydrolase [Armatimonadota bacterium]
MRATMVGVIGVVLALGLGQVLLMEPETKEMTQPEAGSSQPDRWKAVHLLVSDPAQMELVHQAIKEVLKPLGVNTIVFEVNYRFAYRSHPELVMEPAMTEDQAKDLTKLCRSLSIRLIPQFNCLGHQSWAETTFPLLIQYPELDETPQIPKNNPGIYCRSWCPLHPDVNKIVFALLDELIDAFEADAFHIGMDEVFLIASDQCPRCRGKDPADLFAKAVNDLYDHLAVKRKKTVLMWGDRFLDDKEMGYGEWEASRNGTAPAVDKVPKDIIICDWHYGRRDSYPSVPFFISKGFRVLPAGWKDEEAALSFLRYSRQFPPDKVLGYMATTWVGADEIARALLKKGNFSETAREAAQALISCMRELKAAAD